MLTPKEQSYLDNLPLAEQQRIVRVQPYDPELTKTAEAIIEKIRGILPGVDVRFMGASALGISGQNDIDLYILAKPDEHTGILGKLAPWLGEQVKHKWHWYEDGFEVSIYVADPEDQNQQRQTLMHEILKASPALLAEYEQLKAALNGGAYREYQTAKYEFYNRVLGNDQVYIDWMHTVLKTPSTATKVLSSEKNTVYQITSGAATYFLKISANLKPEKDRLDWLQGKLPAPQVTSFTTIAGRDALLMTAVRGENLASLAQAWGAEKVITKLVAALHRFHATDISGCPFGEPGEGSVLVHGDACLPNFIYHGEELSGYIDLGDMAVGSVEVDLSAAVWTLQYNFGKGCRLKFLQEYGIAGASEKMAEELRQRYEDKI